MENIIKIIVGVGGGLASYLFGGWSMLLETLIFFIVADYIIGVIVAGINGELNSKVGFRGIAKKVLLLLVVAIAHRIDLLLGEGSLVRNSAIFFYIANEILSIFENIGKTNLPIPNKVRNAVEVLKGKGDGTNG